MSEIIINAAEAMAMLKKHYFRGLKEMIATAPEIVRCKDCEHYNTSGCADGFGWCEALNRGSLDDCYCEHGERKDDGEID